MLERDEKNYREREPMICSYSFFFLYPTLLEFERDTKFSFICDSPECVSSNFDVMKAYAIGSLSLR